MLKSFRLDENFNELWGSCLESKNELDVKKPKLQRMRKIPKIFDDGAQPAVYYKQTYFEILDIVTNCLDDRFSQ